MLTYVPYAAALSKAQDSIRDYGRNKFNVSDEKVNQLNNKTFTSVLLFDHATPSPYYTFPFVDTQS